MKRLSLIVATLLSMLVACSPIALPTAPTATPLPITPVFFATDTPTPTPDPIYLNIIWQFHQPLYTADPQTNLITRPWVRVYGTRLYFEMASQLARYSKVHTTFNFSPVLLRQLDDLLAGARDQYWELASKPADSLSDSDKNFVLTHFYEADPAFVKHNARYKELLDKRDAGSDASAISAAQAFNEQDLRDLQVWYLLSNFGTGLLAESPLKEWVAQARNFSEDDKHTIMNVALDMLHNVFPFYSQLQESGQVELSVSPYAQPILPLLLDTNLERQINPKTLLPDPPFRSSQDVNEQLKRAGALYEHSFNTKPRGLIPVAGAVSPNIVDPIATNGYQWIASGETVLAKSLKLPDFSRDAKGIPQNADQLYRPYHLSAGGGHELNVIFRDSSLTTLISSTYSTLAPAEAADDFVNRLVGIQASLRKAKAGGPHLVTLILDGESVWQRYPDGGSAFLEALYARLSEAADRQQVVTMTPSEYLAQFPDQRALDSLPAGSWNPQGHGDFSTWIGSPESNAAWSNLARARTFLDAYLTGAKMADTVSLQKAYDILLLAEGADWLQGHSVDENPDGTAYLDDAFRNMLGQVYTLVGVPEPDTLRVPVLPARVYAGDQSHFEVITPTIDGIADTSEWDGAGVLKTAAASQIPGNSVVSAFYYGANTDSLFFRIDAQDDWSALATDVDGAQSVRVGVYLTLPGSAAASAFTRVAGDGEVRAALNMSATHLLEWSMEADGSASAALFAANTTGGWTGTPVVSASSAAVGKVLELAVPIHALGGLPANTTFQMLVIIMRDGHVIGDFPANGVAQMQFALPGIAQPKPVQTLGSFDDPIGDDHGPGSYTYPTDPVFQKGSFDLKHVTIARDDKDLVFQLDMAAPIDNVWNSPIGLSLQTFDIYIDQDPGKGTGDRRLLEGRNATLPKKYGWEYALWVEGWNQQVFTPDGKGGFTLKEDAQLKVEVDPTGSVTIKVPLAALGGGDPSTWSYAIAVLSQEAYPSDGVRRVRDVDPAASQWRIGGAPNDTNHTRILDVLVPPGSAQTQEDGLGHYPASQEKDVSQLNADSFGTIPMVTIDK